MEGETNKHRPFHIYYGHTYFVSGACYKGLKVINSDKKKSIFKTKLAQISKEMNIGILAWVVLDNHYHLLFLLNVDENGVANVYNSGVTNASSSSDRLASVTPQEATSVTPQETVSVTPHKKLPNFIRRLHSITAKEFNHLDQTPGRQIWYQYWDYCIRNIPDFWKHFNYTIKNPLKHGLVFSLPESYRFKYSSNPVWLERFSEEGIEESFIKFPVKEWVPRDCG